MFEDFTSIKDDIETMVKQYRDVLQATHLYSTRVMWYDPVSQHAPVIMLVDGPNGGNEGAIAWAMKANSTVCRHAEVGVVISDALWALEGTKADGTEWAPGDLEYALENQTEDAANVQEALVFHAAKRDGSQAVVVVPYAHVGGTSIVFDYDNVDVALPTTYDLSDSEPLQHITLAMTHMTIWDAAKEGISGALDAVREAGDDDDAEFFVMTVGVGETMKATGFPCMIHADTDRKREVVHTVMRDPDEFKMVSGADIKEFLDLETNYRK